MLPLLLDLDLYNLRIVGHLDLYHRTAPASASIIALGAG